MSNCNLCASIKSKKEKHIQCPYKKKENSNFCGKHQINPICFNALKSIENNVKDNIDNNNYLLVNELLTNVQENKTMTISIIRKSIKNSYLKNFINTKLTKQNLLSNIRMHIFKERNYLNNEDKIILIQSLIRMYVIRYKYICTNEIDILTMNNKLEIGYPYFYRFFNNKNKKYYAYDIRLLHKLINSNYPSCPYTFREFEENEKNDIMLYVQNLEKKNIKIQIVKELTEDEKIENKTKDLFYKINMLDNYTCHKWFMDLDTTKLIKLYIAAEDIWNYRSLLNHQSKYNIIRNNHIFNIPVMMIKKIKSLNKLRNILLDTFDIMISNGIDINEKKLGAILVLSSIVEISIDAANALPHLVQV